MEYKNAKNRREPQNIDLFAWIRFYCLVSFYSLTQNFAAFQSIMHPSSCGYDHSAALITSWGACPIVCRRRYWYVTLNRDSSWGQGPGLSSAHAFTCVPRQFWPLEVTAHSRTNLAYFFFASWTLSARVLMAQPKQLVSSEYLF